MKLSARHAQFVREYLVDLDAAAAARRAGYSPHSATKLGQRLLRHQGVKAAVDAAMVKRAKNAEARAERWREEVERIAYVELPDDADAFSERGKLKALELLGRHEGLLRDKVEVSGKDGAPVNVFINLGAAGG